LNEARRGLQVITPARAKKWKMQQRSVHFAIAWAIYLSLTPENQCVDFLKYQKSAKTNISRKHACGNWKVSCSFFPTFGLTN
jgi:hypothetical protein